MRRLVALVGVLLAGAGCASHHGSVNAANTTAPTAQATASTSKAATAPKKSTAKPAQTGVAPNPTHTTPATNPSATRATSTSAPAYDYQMSGVLPDVFPGGTGNSSTSDTTVSDTPTSTGHVFSYPTSNGRLAVLLANSASGWFKAGDGSSTNPRNCAWSPHVEELANSGSWHVDSSCTISIAGSSTTLHLVEDAAVVGTDSVVVGGQTLSASHVHRTGTLTISRSGSTSTTNFTEDLWWLTDRGVVAKATANNTTKQTSVLSSTTTNTTGSLSLLSIR